MFDTVSEILFEKTLNKVIQRSEQPAHCDTIVTLMSEFVGESKHIPNKVIQ